MANKLISCKSCGAQIAANAKTCPQCGAKNKKPIYKQWWLYVLAVVILFAVIGGSGSAGSNSGTTAPAKTESASAAVKPAEQSKPTPEPIEYAHYDVTELFDALKGNAMKAQNTFKGQYVELEGYLGTIDSNGKYIGLKAADDNYDYLFQEVQCYLKTEEQKSIVMEMNAGDHIIVCGKIKDVGEILGYSLNIDSIG